MNTRRAAAAIAAAALLPLTQGGSASADAARATTEGPITSLASVRAAPGHPTATLRGRVYFQGATGASGVELWSTDGTAAGTRLVADVNPGPGNSIPEHLVAFGDRVLFTATTATGNEWWSTDGTAAGTTQLADIYQGTGSSFPDFPTIVGSKLYFSAYDPALGRELWEYDPARSGVFLVADIRSGGESSAPRFLTAFGDRVVFTGNVADTVAKPFVAGIPGLGGAQRLDHIDSAIDLNPRHYTKLGNRLVFAGGDAVSGVEIWGSGGRPGDAEGVKDIFPGATTSDPRDFVTLGDRVLFRAATPGEGAELWSTNGTTAGTVLVKDIDTRAGGSSYPDGLTVLGDQVLFSAVDAAHGRELWATRGTAATTQLVVDGYPGTVGGLSLDSQLGRFPVGGRMLYAGLSPAGAEPWVTDGTTAGTRQIADVTVGGDTWPFDLGVLGNTVVFGGTEGITERVFAWTAVGSTVTVTPKKKYAAKQARRKRVVVPVTVTSSLGAPLSGGTVVLTRNGRTVGSAPLVNGTARIRITVRLKPGRQHLVVATWAGDLTAAGSASAATRIVIKKDRKKR